jgi:hypothetical protein
MAQKRPGVLPGKIGFATTTTADYARGIIARCWPVAASLCGTCLQRHVRFPTELWSGRRSLNEQAIVFCVSSSSTGRMLDGAVESHLGSAKVASRREPYLRCTNLRRDLH